MVMNSEESVGRFWHERVWSGFALFSILFAGGFNGLVTTAISQTQTMPLKVDINSEGRSDMKTYGWENWRPDSNSPVGTFGDIQVEISGGHPDDKLLIKGNKALVAAGTTVGADCIISDASGSGLIQLKISGLPPGPHTFVGFHQSLSDDFSDFTLSIDGVDSGVFRHSPVSGVPHNDDVCSSFARFVVLSGKPVVLTMTPVAIGQSVGLSGFALDLSNPIQKALKPNPPDWDRHADGDKGWVTLSWTPPADPHRYRVFVSSSESDGAADLDLLVDEPDPTFLLGEYDSPECQVNVSQDSLLQYAWRVDSIQADGAVVRGDVWHFRVRQVAFPGAEGYGRFAIGGRGGRVIHVTNLNDSGPGSLRDAILATGPRTVVFDVSGLISLKSKLVFRSENEFLTVAGQTAPGKGICIRNYTFGGLGARDTIIRFIRLRLGDLAGETMDGMGLAGSDHCIVDHCSISWSIDEAFSSRGAQNITFQRNIISEALNIAGHRKYEDGKGHGYAGSIGGNVGSFHHSLLAHNAGRNWSLAGGIDQANIHAGRIDIRNMVVYNWKNRTTDGGARQVNFVNNYYKPGPASEIFTFLNPQFENPAFGPQQYFAAGNIMEGYVGPADTSIHFKGIRVRGTQEAPAFVSDPFFESHVTTHSARDAYEDVLSDVGCNRPRPDDHDLRVIGETRTGTFTYRGSRSGLPGLPDSQSDTGGWEPYPEIHRPADWDSDRDGLPNHWELENGLDPQDPSDGSADSDHNGYTNLEEYLHHLASSPAP